MRRIITAALAVLLLAAMTVVSATQAGTASDSLVTKQYVESTYTQSLMTRINQLIAQRLGGSFGASATDPWAGSSAGDTALTGPGGGMLSGYEYTSGNRSFNLPPAGQITMGQGGSVVVTSGQVTLTVNSGEVIDIASGETVPSGTVLLLRRRYFCTESTVAIYSASGWASVMADGPYVFAGDPAAQAYRDVKPGDWFSAASLYAWQKQIFRDWDGPDFRPNDTVTRAEIIYAIWTAAGSPASDFMANYDDITESWYLPAVCWASEKGIVQGTGNFKLSPNDPVDRATIVTMLFRATAVTGASSEGRADLTAFTDAAAIPDWSAEAVSWAVANGVVLGVGDGSFAPGMVTSRGQIAALLMRMFD